MRDDAPEPWPRYRRWNDCLRSAFFGDNAAHRPVYLDVTAESLTALAAKSGLGEKPVESFIADVKATLRLSSSQGVFSLHEAWLEYWVREEGRAAVPPCIALLGLFSLAAEAMHSDTRWNSNNYYARLAELLGVPGADRKKLEDDFRRHSTVFWEALNIWVEAGAGLRGVPTAYALDSRRYVSVPISQTLLREADRARLLAIFSEMGFAGGQRMAPADMQAVLAQALGALGPRLSRLWATEDVRARLAEIACRELEAWRGVALPDVSARQRQASLLLSASLRKSPVAYLDLSCRVPLSPTSLETFSHFSVPSPAPPHSRHAFPTGLLHLTPIDDGQWLAPVDSAEFSIAELIQGNVQLDHERLRVHRSVRRVIVLALHDDLQVFIEAARVELGSSYLVMAHASVADATRRQLSDIACQGFNEWTSRQLKGLPADWLLFSGVTVLRVAKSPAPDLNPLEALSKIQVTAGGGFALPLRAYWHLSRAPELRVGADEESSELRIARRIDGPEAWRDSWSQDGKGSFVFDVARHSPQPGTYRATLTSDGKLASALTFHIASADSPRQLPPDGNLSGLGWPLSGDGVQPSPAACTLSGSNPPVRGALIPAGIAEPRKLAGGGALPVRLAVSATSSEFIVVDADVIPATAAPASCVSSAHVFLCPTAYPGRSTPREGKCKHCGLEKQFARLAARGESHFQTACQMGF